MSRPDPKVAAQLSEKEYVENGGSKCPVCTSQDLDVKQPDFDVDYIWVNVVCFTCKSQWTDIYKLTGYVDLEQN